MSSQLNVSVLVAARDEYTNQLKKYLVPLIQEGFVSIYEDSAEENSDNPLIQFQTFLKEIPRWNQTILDAETKRIKDRCPFLMDCVTAIFVSHVKILASVRLGGNHSNIRIKIPTPEIFVHSIYIAAAEPFYYDPEPFSEVLARKNVETIRNTIEYCIDDTISGMIPIQNILQEYLQNTFTEHINPLPVPEPEPETPGNILSGTEILDEPIQPQSSIEKESPPFGSKYDKESDPLDFDIGKQDGYGSDVESVKSDISDIFSNDGTQNEVKEINLGDEIPSFTPPSDTTQDTPDDTSFNPLGFLGIGSDSKHEETMDSDVLNTDFNFFDDTNVDF